jgi:guanylate kinase
LEEYERRLRKRATEDEASIQGRLSVARAELALAPTYSYQIINDDLDSATARLRAFVADQFARARHDG